MAIGSNIEYGILNISTHPHPDGVYVELLKSAAKTKVKFWGDLYASISEPIPRGDGFWQGRIVIWTEIDEDAPAIKLDDLAETDLTELDFHAPENIGFNGRIFLYVLRDSDHKVFFELKNELGKTLSATRTQRIFSKLFSGENIAIDSPLVEVTVVPKDDAVAEVLAIPRLKRLEISIIKPNADGIEDKYQEVMQDLEEQGLRRQDILQIAAPDGGGVQPNEKTQKQAEVAATNGYVKGLGRGDDGEPIAKSTKEYPRIIKRLAEQIDSTIGEIVQVAKTTIINIRGD